MFEVGQRVRVKFIHDEMSMDSALRKTIGRTGVVEWVDGDDYDGPHIKVFFGVDVDDWWLYYPNELEAVDD